MSISIDHVRAKNILFEEASLARQGIRSARVKEWEGRVTKLGLLCPHGRSSTVLAALGTAILAKATDDRVDVYSLLDRGEAADSYSARSLADNVLARHRAELGLDIGAKGTNPLNNTPFIGKTRIDEITGVRNQDGWKYFIESVEALKGLADSGEAREALRGFILARGHSPLTPIDVPPQAGDQLAPTDVLRVMDEYVAENSEGGRRAQSCVAAILDATFGVKRVIVGVINDPDRHAPLDVSVTNGEEGFIIAFEVKDKPIADYHVRSTIERTVANHGLRNLGFVAVSKQQRIRDFDEVVKWAAARGVKVTMFLNWDGLYLACKCFAPATNSIFEGQVYRRLLVRGQEMGVSRAGLEKIRKVVEGSS